MKQKEKVICYTLMVLNSIKGLFYLPWISFAQSPGECEHVAWNMVVEDVGSTDGINS